MSLLKDVFAVLTTSIFDCLFFVFHSVPPPHLSPFVDNEAEGHVPEYAEAIERLKAAARKEVLPLPGMGKDDLDDPQALLGIIGRVEDIEAHNKRQKVFILDAHDINLHK